MHQRVTVIAAGGLLIVVVAGCGGSSISPGPTPAPTVATAEAILSRCPAGL